MDKVLDEVLRQVHIVGIVVEGHLRLNHPKLCQVARGIRVLSSERRAKGVDLSQSHGGKLALQLTGDGKIGLLTEEVLAVVYFTLLSTGRIGYIQRRHLEHLPGSLSIRGSDQRSVEVDKPLVVEVLVNRICHIVADAEDCTKGVGPRAEVSHLSQELKGVLLLLQRIRIGVCRAVDLNGISLYLYCLSLALTLYQLAVYRETGTGGDLLEQLLIDLALVGNDLEVIHRGAVIHGDEGDILATPLGADPPLDIDLLIDVLRILDEVDYLYSFHKVFLSAYSNAPILRLSTSSCVR